MLQVTNSIKIKINKTNLKSLQNKFQVTLVIHFGIKSQKILRFQTSIFNLQR